MPKDHDIAQIRSIIREFHLTREQGWEFSEFVHELKREGLRGTKNKRGDFLYSELRQLAQDFLADQAE